MNYKEFLNKFQNKEVDVYQDVAEQEPMVSICVQTYQHGNYIKQCLDGILMQQTIFPFEILLGEDVSTDGTREICIEYAQKHPDKIRLFLHHRENNIAINGTPTGRFNFLYNLYNARGKYIALCEGDDYWTDPLKLQKQVDFLEEKVAYAVCEHVVEEVNFYTKVSKQIPAIKHSKDFSIEEYIQNNIGATCSLVFRRQTLDDVFLEKLHQYPFGDWPLKLYLLKKSNHKSRMLIDVMGVYRIHDKSIHGSLRNNNNGLIAAYKQHLTCINLFQKNLLSDQAFEKPIMQKKMSTLSTLLKLTDNSFEKLPYFIQLSYLKLIKRLK